MYPAQCLLVHTLYECGASHTGAGGRQVRHQEVTVMVTKKERKMDYGQGWEKGLWPRAGVEGGW